MSGNILNKKINDQIEELYEDSFHLSQYFPEDSNETITLAAGGTNNTFGAWAEIVDNNAVTFSSKLVACSAHISNVIIENASVKDKIYILEISYGTAKTIVLRDRVLSATTLLSTVQQGRRKSLGILGGETVYYRLKCETAGATLRVSLRYHCH